MCSSTTWRGRTGRPARAGGRATTSCSVPVSRTRTGSSRSASAGMSSTATPPLCAAATAAARSPGAGAPLARHSSTDAVPSVTPSGSDSLHSQARTGGARRGTAPRRRSTGVNRQSSSRPVGTGKSATSYDVGRSARDWFGDDRRGAVGVRARGRGARRLVSSGHQPTAPSICSSMRRLSSRAYSIGQLARDRLDEAAHDHRHGLVLGHAAGHQVEQLVLAHLRDGGLVAHLHVVLADVDVGVGVGAADRVDQQRVADDRDFEPWAPSRTCTRPR